jgi:transcriptional regulator with XRE-family HTH domain
MRNKKNKLDCALLEIFAFNVQYYRKAAGLTQFELAKNSGYAHNFINDIENKKKGASFATVENIALALKVDPFFLFINPKDRLSGENHNLIGYLTAAKKIVDNFFEGSIKELSGDKDKPKKKGAIN